MSVDAVEMDMSGVGAGPNHSGPSPEASARARRVRPTSRTYSVAEEEAFTDIAKAAEAKLAQRRNARAEARKIRMLELDKLQKEAEEQMDKEYKIQQEEKKNAAQAIASVSVVTGSTGGSSSRRGSAESIDNDLIKLADAEEKYKKAMMTNAQLDNDKSALVYDVDCLKDVLADQEEHMMELTREARDKHRDLETKKRENSGLKRDVDVLKEMVEQRDQLISEHGLLLVGGSEQADGGDSSKPPLPKVGTIVVVSPEAAELLEVVGDGPLDVRLKRFVEERKQLLEQIRRLKIDLEDCKERAENAERRRANPITINGPDLDAHDVQREATKQVGEYKFKLQKAEQDITNLGGQVVRLEGQVRRFKTSSDVAEKNEEELKQEKRKMTRENRLLREKVEEIETTNSHLQKRLDRFLQRKPEH